jgi:hypothetical protein
MLHVGSNIVRFGCPLEADCCVNLSETNLLLYTEQSARAASLLCVFSIVKALSPNWILMCQSGFVSSLHSQYTSHATYVFGAAK